MAAALLLVAIPSCGESGTKRTPSAPDPATTWKQLEKPRHAKPVVVTSFYPTLYFARRLAGAQIEASCITPEGEDPVHWMPDAASIERLQDADCILLNGAGLESWLTKIDLPLSRLVDTSKSFAKEYQVIVGSVKHRHGGGKAHTHDGVDPHLWLSPRNARRQALAIHAALLRLLPKQSDALLAALGKLEKELSSLDAGFKSLGKQPKNEVWLSSHPAYNYLAKDYGWRLHNLLLDPQDPIPDSATNELEKLRKRNKVKFLLWEASPSQENEAKAKSLGLTSLVISPCEMETQAMRKAGSDYLAVMRKNLQTLRAAFRR